MSCLIWRQQRDACRDSSCGLPGSVFSFFDFGQLAQEALLEEIGRGRVVLHAYSEFTLLGVSNGPGLLAVVGRLS